MAKTFYKENVKCWLCGFPIPLTASLYHPVAGSRDHVIPRSKGGRDHHNILPAHRKCNQIRASREVTPKVIEQCRQGILGEFRLAPHLVPHGKKYRSLHKALNLCFESPVTEF